MSLIQPSYIILPIRDRSNGPVYKTEVPLPRDQSPLEKQLYTKNLSQSPFMSALPLILIHSSVFIPGEIIHAINSPIRLILTFLRILLESNQSQPLNSFQFLLRLVIFMLSVYPMKENCMLGGMVSRANWGWEQTWLSVIFQERYQNSKWWNVAWFLEKHNHTVGCMWRDRKSVV